LKSNSSFPTPARWDLIDASPRSKIRVYVNAIYCTMVLVDTLVLGGRDDRDEDLRLRRPVILLRELPASARSLRRFQADSRAGSARDEKKPAVVMSNTCTDLQGFYGSDGTRTRDLRRDRPCRAVCADPREGARTRMNTGLAGRPGG
jgi:hypothetical protein